MGYGFQGQGQTDSMQPMIRLSYAIALNTGTTTFSGISFGT